MLAGMNHRVYLELGPKKVFACSIDWPGWCRIGKTEEAALGTLVDYTPRFRVIAERAGLEFAPGEPEVVARVKGDSTTDFGAISAIPGFDREPVDAPEAARAAALARAAWAVFAEVTAASPEELRKGPRGGGRDRDKMVSHVVEAERAYARKIGVRHKPFKDEAGRIAMREDIVRALERPAEAFPPGGEGWPVRYAARRIIWHVVDHIWEMEDRRL
ncbi:hypothetical protein SAMN05421833_11338 [Microbispora rosea]|uniref:DinB superfamily protein n=2 Tax=Microbispora rosea TaxID=58117 RepID=A0A1N7D0D4_9ACTN|nr:hypothetical protein Mro03_40010 [Microbispora rosea subsp. rosea]SIR69250.1 hypothetical protein SAMN05421833_11338 [Microbispora rosea]